MSCFLILALLAQVGQSPMVPSSYADAARGNPFEFAQMLVHLGVPTGLEIRQQDYVQRATAVWMYPIIDHPLEAPSGAAQPLEAVLDSFNRTHADYSAQLVDSAVIIRPKETRFRFSYLDSSSPRMPRSVEGIQAVVGSVLSPWDSTLKNAGSAGSFLSPVGVTEIETGRHTVLAIDSNAKTVVQVLNQAIRQVPHQGWVLITRSDNPQDLIAIGFLHQYLTGSYVYVNQDPSTNALAVKKAK